MVVLKAASVVEVMKLVELALSNMEAGGEKKTSVVAKLGKKGISEC